MHQTIEHPRWCTGQCTSWTWLVDATVPSDATSRFRLKYPLVETGRYELTVAQFILLFYWKKRWTDGFFIWKYNDIYSFHLIISLYIVLNGYTIWPGIEKVMEKTFFKCNHDFWKGPCGVSSQTNKQIGLHSVLLINTHREYPWGLKRKHVKCISVPIKCLLTLTSCEDVPLGGGGGHQIRCS